MIKPTGFLVLENGKTFAGVWNGPAQAERAGEIVFNTSHSGYEEIATDPSYMNQIICMTAPMMGNYGVNDSHWESAQFWIEGFICLEIQNSIRDDSWLKRLNSKNISILSEVDTRRLTLELRANGTPWGALVCASTEVQAKEKAFKLINEKKRVDKDWVFYASTKEAFEMKGQNNKGPRIAVLDFGTKSNILRELQKRASSVKVFNSRTSAEVISQWKPDGLMLTNGPGDPSDVLVAPETVKNFLGRVPVFGICMGHQILGIALGAKTYKLKFGHRGSNHPIRDELLKRVYVSSQNHGYAVDEKTLPSHVKVTHTNLNDGSVAGVYSESLRCLGIQYHPEACPGPHEAQQLFQFFTEKMI